MTLRSIRILYICLLFPFVVEAQYGNEWIREAQPYLSFKISQQGIYRIALNQINWTNLNPSRLQLFRNGKEEALYLSSSNIQNGYIEFYAKNADAALDSFLFQNPNEMPHGYTNYISDTICYFLTQLSDTAKDTPLRYKDIDSNLISNATEIQTLRAKSRIIFNEYYFGGTYIPMSEPYYLSDYGGGEGWYTEPISQGNYHDWDLNVSHPISNTSVDLNIVSAACSNAIPGSNGANHHVEFSLIQSNSTKQILLDSIYNGYGLIRKSFHVPNYNLNAASFRLTVPDDIAVNSDLHALSLIECLYDKNLSAIDSLSFEFGIPANQSNYIHFKIASNPLNSAIIYQIQTHSRVRGISLNGFMSFYLPYATTGNWIQMESRIQYITQLNPVSFVKLYSNNTQVLFISNKKLASAANAYLQYRQTTKSSSLVFVDELYNTFSYGNNHPIAIKRYCKFLYDTQVKKPEYLILLGRGYQTNLVRSSSIFNYYGNNLVPAIGVPSSDQLYSEGFDGHSGYGSLMTGRIPASSDEELLNYLNKLKQQENILDSTQLWRKNILHLSGGSSQSEQNDFQSILADRAETANKSMLGANIISYHKSTNEPTQNDLKLTLSQSINQGKSLITFLGHGSMTILDLDFGSIQDMQTNQKFPLFYFNGCNIGNANDIDPGTNGQVYGKTFLCTANKGAIGWIAHTNFTLRDYLDFQTNAFYQSMFLSQYGKSLGEIIQHSLSSLNNADPIQRSHNLQMLLQGDPLYHLYSPIIPDYSIDASDVYVDAQVNASMDSIPIHIIVKNAGAYLAKNIELSASASMPGVNSISIQPIKYTAPKYIDTFQLWVHVPIGGTLQLKIQVKSEANVNEFNLSNNSCQVQLNIPGTNLQVLYPAIDALVNKDSVVLVCQQSNLITDLQSYEIEWDTSGVFINGKNDFHRVSSLMAKSLIAYKMPYVLQDNTVYYWRIRQENTKVWSEGRFVSSVDTMQGWKQIRAQQWSKSFKGNLIEFDSLSSQWRFADDIKELGVYVRRWNANGNTISSPYILNAQVYKCMSEGVVACVFNPYSPDVPIEAPHYPFNCSNIIDNKNGANDISLRYYTFNTSNIGGVNELTAFLDSIPDAYVTALFSRYNTHPGYWTEELRNALKKFGSVKVANMQSDWSAWALIGIKNKGQAIEDTLYNDRFIGQAIPNPADNDSASAIRIKRQINGRWFNGKLLSPWIGASDEWHELIFDLYSLESNKNGSVYFSIYGQTKTGDVVQLKNQISSTRIDLRDINAQVYPYLQFEIILTDSQYRTPDQVNYWTLLYKPAADLSLNFDSNYLALSPKISQGDSLHLHFSVVKFNRSVQDKVIVRYEISNNSRQTKYLTSDTIEFEQNKNEIKIQKDIASYSLEGENTLQVNVRFLNKINEQMYSNNQQNWSFIVETSHQNPYLDVLIDGYRISSGDYISANPQIECRIKSPNKNLILSDTSIVQFNWRKPESFDFENIPFANTSTLKWLPANEPNNWSKAIFTPGKLSDGLYSFQIKLFQNNASHTVLLQQDFDFNIENKSRITAFYPYPNPFTTQTRFVFGLSGSEIPNELMLRIFTISGKLIREVRSSEFGPIHIGNNISEFAWDGADQYGDKVANGVYLYQVQVRINGSSPDEWKGLNAEEDKCFIHHTGKMVLIR